MQHHPSASLLPRGLSLYLTEHYGVLLCVIVNLSQDALSIDSISCSAPPPLKASAPPTETKIKTPVSCGSCGGIHVVLEKSSAGLP